MPKFSKELLQLYEHPKWRYVIRPAVIARDAPDGKCPQCGKPFTFKRPAQVDHKCYPPRGSKLTAYLNQSIEDMQCLCKSCHSKKTKADRSARRKAKK